MAGFFKKKARAEKGGPAEPPGGAATPASSKRPLFQRGPKPPKPPKVREEQPETAAMTGGPEGAGPLPSPEKKPRKPLFGFGKRAPKAKKEKKPAPPKEARPPKEKRARARGGAGKLSPVGLDIGRTTLTAVQLKYQTGGAALMSAAVDQLPEGLVQEGEVRDVEALSLALKDFWKNHKIRGRKVELGLANQKVVVRVLEFPLLEEKELRTAIEFQAQDYIPIPIEEAVLDYHVLARETDESGIEKQKVLVVAAQKNMVLDFMSALKKARLSVAGIDLQAFALLRAMVPKSFLEAEPEGGAIALANIASDVTNLVVSMAGEPQFNRVIFFGEDNFTKAVQDLKRISFVQAEELKMKAGLPGPGQRAEEKGPEKISEADTSIIHPVEPGEGEGGPLPMMPSEEQAFADVQRVLEHTADALADEIRRSLDYYMSQETSVPIARLILCGGGATLPNLDMHLSQIFPFEVTIGDPLKQITQNRSDLADEDLKVLGPRLATGIGLALEDEE